MYTSKPSPSENLGVMAQQSKNSTAFICTHSLFFRSSLTATIYRTKVLVQRCHIKFMRRAINKRGWMFSKRNHVACYYLRIPGVMLAYITGLVHSLVASTVMFYSISKFACNGKIFSYKRGFFKYHFLESIQSPYLLIFPPTKPL